MRERPILFSAPMVRAILAGTKSQTRRLIKPSPSDVVAFIGSDNQPTGEFGLALDPEYTRVLQKHVRCPYGVPGDRLWVREAWCEAEDGFAYAADLDPRQDPRGMGWRPSIHMPRIASRIMLEVTAVRAQRLQDISEADAIAEGATSRAIQGRGNVGWCMDWSDVGRRGPGGKPLTERDICLGDPQMAFANYINGLHGGPRWNFHYSFPDRYPPPLWEQNPWVWAVSFRRAEA